MLAVMLCGTDDNIVATIAKVGIEYLSVAIVNANRKSRQQIAILIHIVVVNEAIPKYVRE